jgi:glycosyltransferase involved in cell wall biosynthesis
MKNKSIMSCKKCAVRSKFGSNFETEEWIRNSIYTGRVTSALNYKSSCACRNKIEKVTVISNSILIDLTHTWKSRSKTGIQNYALNLAGAMQSLNSKVIFISNEKGIIRSINTDIYSQKLKFRLQILEILQRFWRKYLKNIDIIRRIFKPISSFIYNLLYKDVLSKESLIPVNCTYVAPESILGKEEVESLIQIQNVSNNKFFLCIHDIFPVTHSEYSSNYTRENVSNFLDLIFNTKNFICQTETVKKSLNHLIEARKIISAPNDVKNHFINVLRRPVIYDLENTKEKISESVYFVAVGTIEPRKNLMQLLRVFERIWASELKIELRILGSYGWNYKFEEDKIKELISKGLPLSFIQYPSTEEIFECIKRSRALILTSIAEGVGLTPGEAISVGIPVIVNTIPSVVETYPKNLLCVYDGTDHDLEKRILENLDSTHFGKASANILDISWEESAKTFLALIGE